MAGGRGELVTGHAVLRLADGEIDRVAEGHAVTGVRFAEPVTEPSWTPTWPPASRSRWPAGSPSTGCGGWFVEGIDGDPSTSSASACR